MPHVVAHEGLQWPHISVTSTRLMPLPRPCFLALKCHHASAAPPTPPSESAPEQPWHLPRSIAHSALQIHSGRAGPAARARPRRLWFARARAQPGAGSGRSRRFGPNRLRQPAGGARTGPRRQEPRSSSGSLPATERGPSDSAGRADRRPGGGSGSAERTSPGAAGCRQAACHRRVAGGAGRQRGGARRGPRRPEGPHVLREGGAPPTRRRGGGSTPSARPRRASDRRDYRLLPPWREAALRSRAEARRADQTHARTQDRQTHHRARL